METHGETLECAARIPKGLAFLDRAIVEAADPILRELAKAAASSRKRNEAALATSAPSFACLARGGRSSKATHSYQLRSWSSSRLRRSPCESNAEFFHRCSRVAQDCWITAAEVSLTPSIIMATRGLSENGGRRSVATH